MSLISVLSVNVKPECQIEYQERVAELAQRAREKADPFAWTAHQSLYGGAPMLHFGARVGNFAELAELGQIPEMVVRVFGEQKGREEIEAFGRCVFSQTLSVSVDRPDLSYAPEGETEIHPAASLTVLRPRMGRAEACEELIRKLAEAIPKLDDTTRIMTYQTAFGDLSQFWTVRPMRELADLDRQKSAEQLLNEAFGQAEGGLIRRTGLDALESAERSILTYRADLSNWS